jgi:hypothetical protein
LFSNGILAGVLSIKVNGLAHQLAVHSILAGWTVENCDHLSIVNKLATGIEPDGAGAVAA